MPTIVIIQVPEWTKIEENNTQVAAAFQQKHVFHCYSATDFKQQLLHN